MKARFNECGKVYGHLTVDEKCGYDLYIVRCSCGVKKPVRGSELRRGQTSCGCQRSAQIASAKTIHGHTHHKGRCSRTYEVWRGMRDRCNNPREAMYRHYGGRGIKVCDRWNDFAAFLADMGEPPAGCSIERINNDGNYEPTNCRWATRAEQARNTRQNVQLTLNGRTQCVADWAGELGIKPSTVYARVAKGWPAERALSTERQS